MKLKLTLLIFLVCLNAQASNRVDEFISFANSLLPKKMQQLNTHVSFKKLNDIPLGSPCDSKGFIYGKYNNKTITLSEQLLDHLTPNDNVEFNCKHKNLYKTALSTLLHENLHAYEDGLKNEENLHLNKEFLSLGFWKLNKKNKNLNTYAERSPNYYEYTSPKEFTAVNFEYFILDPQFKCRRPNLYNAYVKKLAHVPFEDVKCSSRIEVSITDTQKVDLVKLDLNKVREIHYLYASKGKAAMSRWGHSMYKLVLCDQDWTLEKCRMRGKFVVIGFLAQVEDMSINALKGIFGKYPSDMTITTLDAMKKQYNRSELRDLESIPLSFNTKEKERFINHLIRIYWEYSGKYYFFSNNCADEAFKLIQIAKNSKDIYSKGVLSPVGIYKYIKKNNLSKDFSFEDRDINIKNGLLYSSYAPKLNVSFERLKVKFKKQLKVKIKRPNINRSERHFKPTTKSLKDIYDYSSISTIERREIIKEIIKIKDRKSLLDLFSIESQANYVETNETFSQIQKLAGEQISDYEMTDILGQIIDLKNIITFGTVSENSGYGIPQDGDLENTISDEVYEAQEELFELKQVLQEKYEVIFKEEFQKIEDSNYNKILIKNALRSVL